MREMIRKLFIISLMIVTFIGSIFFTYKAYQNYKNNQIIQKSDIYLSLVNKLNTLIKSIDHERLLSALYLGFDGKTDFRQLEKRRQKSDLLFSDIKDFLKSNPDIENLESLKNLTSNLQYVRSRVDVVSSDYQDIIFKYYQDEAIEPMLSSVQNIIEKLSQGLSSYRTQLQSYVILGQKEDRLRLEESFVSFLLGRALKADMPDLVLWNDILAKNSTPFNALTNIPKEQSKKLYQKLKELRISVIKGVANGHYRISVTSWIANMDALIQNITLEQQNLYRKLQNIDFKSAGSESIVSKIVLALSFLLAFIGLGFLLKYRNELPIPTSDNPNIKIKNTSSDKIEEDKHEVEIKEVQQLSRVEPKKEEKPVVEKNENIVLKNPVSSIKNDLPLSNMKPIINEDILPKYVGKDDASVSQQEILKREDKTFYALEEFKMIIKPFIIKADEKNVDFNYDIDPSIPEICIGDIDKIKEFLEIFLSYAINVTPSKGLVVLKIENIAQKKFESAINFTIEDSGRYIDEDERRKIKRAIATHHAFLPDAITHDSLKEDLSYASKLISLLDGRLTISSQQHKGSIFSITLNLKKFISTD